VRVGGLVVAVGDDHLGLGTADHLDEAARGFVEVGLVEAVGMLVGVAVGHPRVAIAEHHDLVEPDHVRRCRQLCRTHGGDERPLLLGGQAVERLTLLAQRRVLQVPFLATGATDQDRVHTFRAVLGQRRGALGGLVVGMSVHGQQRQAVGHPSQAIRRIATSPATVASTVPCDVRARIVASRRVRHRCVGGRGRAGTRRVRHG
jgi:hypothetical protein